MTLLLAPLLALLATGMLWLCWRYDTWRRKGVPSVTPLPLAGNALRMLLQREGLHFSIDRVYQRFRDQPFFGFYAGVSPVLIVRNTELIKDITVKDFQFFQNHQLTPDKEIDPTFSKFPLALVDKEWKDARSKVSPAFSSGRLKSMYTIVGAVGKDLCDGIRILAEKDREVQINRLTTRYGVDLIGSCAFGCEAGALRELFDSTQKPSPYFEVVKAGFSLGALEGLSAFLLLFWRGLYKVLRIPLFKEWRTTVIANLLEQASRHREEQHRARPLDIFDTLLQLKKDGEIPSDVFMGQVMAFQLGGSETSATTIAFALWELAKRPEAQERLREELRAVVTKDIPYEMLHELKYLDAVVKETLRLWPVMPWLDRVSSAPYTIPGSSVTIDAGTVVIIPSFSIQRDPANFQQPNDFLPERFFNRSDDSALKDAWMPFGTGPRSCIGRRFGEMSVKSAVAKVIMNFDVSLGKNTPRTINELPFDNSSFLVTLRDSLSLKFEARN